MKRICVEVRAFFSELSRWLKIFLYILFGKRALSHTHTQNSVNNVRNSSLKQSTVDWSIDQQLFRVKKNHAIVHAKKTSAPHKSDATNKLRFFQSTFSINHKSTLQQSTLAIWRMIDCIGKRLGAIAPTSIINLVNLQRFPSVDWNAETNSPNL